MRQKMTWFILGVLVGSLFLVSAYPTTGNKVQKTVNIHPKIQENDPSLKNSSLDLVHGISMEEAQELIKEGGFILVDSKGLEILKDAKLLPYVIRFGNDGVYAVKILPGGRFFVYGAPRGYAMRDLKKFKEEALEEFMKARFVKYTVPVEIPVNYSWKVVANGKTFSNFSTEAVSGSAKAYLESTITWTSGDNWYPHGRLKLVYNVYKLADVNPSYDWRVVEMQTYVYAGRYLWGPKHDSKIRTNSRNVIPWPVYWEFEKVTIKADVRPDGNDVFSMDSFKPSYDVDYYNDEHSQTIQYTLGNAGASVTITNRLKAVKITVDNTGENWVRWSYRFNRKLGVGDKFVVIEPAYTFSLRIPRGHREATQKFVVTVNWVGNIPLSRDAHASNTIDYFWEWGIN